jgi:hypothetical protein
MSSLLPLPLLIGCNYDETLEKMAPKEESAFAKNYLESVRLRNFVEVKKHLGPELLTPDIERKLTEVSDYFPPGEPIAIKLVGSNVFTSAKHWQANLTFQYQFNDGWAIANVLLVRENEEESVVKGLHVYRSALPLEEIHKFSLQKKSVVHYSFLFFLVATLALILYALIICIKTPINKRKWLWIVFVLVGVGGFNINWTTGETFTQLVSVHLLGIGARTAGPYAPWIVTFSIPFGALVFLFKRKKLMKSEVTEVPETNG